LIYTRRNITSFSSWADLLFGRWRFQQPNTCSGVYHLWFRLYRRCNSVTGVQHCWHSGATGVCLQSLQTQTLYCNWNNRWETTFQLYTLYQSAVHWLCSTSLTTVR